jgi:hypothetical protein
MKPYVSRISYVEGKEASSEEAPKTVEIERYDFLGRAITQRVSVDDIKRVDTLRPFLNYKASGKGLYLHEELIKDEDFADKIWHTLESK